MCGILSMFESSFWKFLRKGAKMAEKWSKKCIFIVPVFLEKVVKKWSQGVKNWYNGIFEEWQNCKKVHFVPDNWYIVPVFPKKVVQKMGQKRPKMTRKLVKM